MSFYKDEEGRNYSGKLRRNADQHAPHFEVKASHIVLEVLKMVCFKAVKYFTDYSYFLVKFMYINLGHNITTPCRTNT